MAFAAGKIMPLSSTKITAYLARILENPTDSTDGVVKKATGLTQSCKTGESIQGFNTNNQIICTRTKTLGSRKDQN